MHDDQWDRLLDETRADTQSQQRVRERWLRRQAQESATLVGTLVDLAEAGAGVSIGMIGGGRHDGVPVGLGVDFVVLDDRGEHVTIRIPAITLVRPHPGAGVPVATGDRAAALDLTFVELLARLVAGQPEVAVAVMSGEVVSGTMLSVGTDVVTLRVAPGADGIAYCSATAVSSARFRSG